MDAASETHMTEAVATLHYLYISIPITQTIPEQPLREHCLLVFLDGAHVSGLGKDHLCSVCLDLL